MSPLLALPPTLSPQLFTNYAGAASHATPTTATGAPLSALNTATASTCAQSLASVSTTTTAPVTMCGSSSISSVTNATHSAAAAASSAAAAGVGTVPTTAPTKTALAAASASAGRPTRRNFRQQHLQVRFLLQQRQRPICPKFSPNSHAPQYLIKAQLSATSNKFKQQNQSPPSQSAQSAPSSSSSVVQEPLLTMDHRLVKMEQQQQNEMESTAHSVASHLGEEKTTTTVPSTTVTLVKGATQKFVTTFSPTFLSSINLPADDDQLYRVTTIPLSKNSASSTVAPYTVMCAPQQYPQQLRPSAPQPNTVSTSFVATTTVSRRSSASSSSSCSQSNAIATHTTAPLALPPTATSADFGHSTNATLGNGGTGPFRSQRKATANKNGGGIPPPAALSTRAATSKGTGGGELKRNDSAGSDGLLGTAATTVRPKRMSILNKQLNYADGEDESEGGGVVPLPAGRPSQIGVGQQFQAELPENDGGELPTEQRQKSAEEGDPYFSQPDPDECLWNGTKFSLAIPTSTTSAWPNQQLLLALKDLELFCAVARRHSKLSIEKALHLLNSSNFCLLNALRNLEQFAAECCANELTKREWTCEMEEHFIELLNKHGKNFGKIAKNLPYDLSIAHLVERYYTLKMERCFSSNNVKFVRCPHIKILGTPTDPHESSPVARTDCANCTQKLWRHPATAVAEWRGRRRPPTMCQPCELYARKHRIHRSPQLLLENDPNYADAKAEPLPFTSEGIGTIATAGTATTAPTTADRTQRRYPGHDDRNCMLAREAATRVRVQQRPRPLLLNIKGEVPTTPAEQKTSSAPPMEESADEADEADAADGEEGLSAAGAGGGAAKENNGDALQEELEMKQRCAMAFMTEGMNFEAIAAFLGGKMSSDDVANFYLEHQFTLRLDYLVSLYDRANADERNVPTLRANAARNNNGQQQRKAPAGGGKKNAAPVKPRTVVAKAAEKRGETVAKREDFGVTRRRKRGAAETAAATEALHPADNSTEGENSVEREEQLLAEKKQINANTVAPTSGNSVEGVETGEKKQKTAKTDK